MRGFSRDGSRCPCSALRLAEVFSDWPSSIGAASPETIRFEEGELMLMKTRSTAEPVPTFAEAGVALNELRRRHIKREPENKRLLEIHVHPQLGALSVTDIEQAHVVEVLYAVRGRAGVRQGRSASAPPAPARRIRSGSARAAPAPRRCRWCLPGSWRPPPVSTKARTQPNGRLRPSA